MKDVLIFSVSQKANQDWQERQIQFIDRYTNNYDLEKIEWKPGPYKICPTISLIEFNPKRYKWVAIMDCDCFPIRENWLQIIEKAMTAEWLRRNEKSKFQDRYFFPKYDFALPIRYEMIEAQVENVPFFLTRSKATDLPVQTESKTIYDSAFMSRTFPLLRSNYTNYDPIQHGIYFDTIYSRNQHSAEYWSMIQGQENPLEDFEGFISELRGLK